MTINLTPVDVGVVGLRAVWSGAPPIQFSEIK